MRWIRLFLMLAVVAGVASEAAAQQDTRPGLAIFAFENGGSYGPNAQDLAPLQVGVQQMLITELAQNTQLRIVERSRLREILDEQNLVGSGRVDPQTAARVGQLVGARYVITGSFIDLGQFRLDARVIDVETGEVLRAEQVTDQRENIYGTIVRMATTITSGLQLPALPAAVAQQRQARQIPAEAVALYSRAQVYEDGGNPDRAIELYRQIADRFPEMTEAREALQQLTRG
jgi:curli biogenesis system outer membrane secretion channel CsgG